MGAAAGKTEGDTHTHTQTKKRGGEKNQKKIAGSEKKIRVFQGVGWWRVRENPYQVTEPRQAAA